MNHIIVVGSANTDMILKCERLPRDVYRDVLLTPNETEAARLTGADDPARAATRLLAFGARAVVMTLGARGALLATADQARVIEGFRVQAVDTTAAGDAFNGGLAVARARGDGLPDAVRYAGAVGALSVTRFGAQPSLPTRDEVEKFLARQK
jgi:ribokinase